MRVYQAPGYLGSPRRDEPRCKGDEPVPLSGLVADAPVQPVLPKASEKLRRVRFDPPVENRPPSPRVLRVEAGSADVGLKPGTGHGDDGAAKAWEVKAG